jgi:hypothetical protein
MISLSHAKQLKAAGLIWQAGTNDYFAIPDRGLDDRLFVLADMQAQLDTFRGWPVVTFHGTAEWALDYILTTEVVWMPRDDQLLDLLTAQLDQEGAGGLRLEITGGTYTCSFLWHEADQQFAGASAGDAYGKALVFLLNRRST